MKNVKKRSLRLNDKWDIFLSPSGDIALTDGLYCDAQNVANAVRLFTNDAYLAKDKGVPHFVIDLGTTPMTSVVRSRFRKAANAVENIADSEVTITRITDGRALEGVITAVTDEGESLTVEL